MERLTDCLQNVNDFLPLFSTFALDLVGNSDCYCKLSTKHSGVNVHPYVWNIKDRQFKCAQQVPSSMAVEPKENCKYKKTRVPMRQNFDWLYKYLQGEEISDSVVRSMAKIIYSRLSSFINYDTDGNMKIFQSRTKGSARYALETKIKLENKMKEICTEDRALVFLTITCDPNKYNGLFDQWENFKERDVNPIIELFRKHYGAQYVGVLESTKNGRPHAHYVLSFSRNEFPELAHISNNKQIKFGKFFDKLQNQKFSKIIYAKKIKGKYVYKYLSKYMTKSEEKEIKSISEKESVLSKTDIKTVVGLFMPIFVGRRSVFWSSKKRTQTKEQLKENRDSQQLGERQFLKRFCEKAHADKLNDREIARLRAYLNEIVLSRPLKCCNDSRIGNYKKLADNFGCKPEEIDTSNQLNVMKVENISTRVGCKGCFYSCIQNFIVSGDDSFLVGAKYNENHEVFLPFSLEKCRNQKNKTWFIKLYMYLWDMMNDMCVKGIPFSTCCHPENAKKDTVHNDREARYAFTVRAKTYFEKNEHTETEIKEFKKFWYLKKNVWSEGIKK